jgi:hypothetical protein
MSADANTLIESTINSPDPSSSTASARHGFSEITGAQLSEHTPQ